MSMTDRAALSAIGVSPVISVPSRDASALTGRDSRCSGAPSSPCRSPLGLARPELGPLHLLEHRCGYTSPSPVENTPSNNECLLVCMRGARVAAFVVHGQEMLCLPQVFELFLKNLVGGLHTVYTKLKRLRISPVVCNVEQVRVLRRLGAIQPGVNRCKLLSRRDFEELYRDCTSAGSRPGRPPKRTPPDGATRTSLHCTPPRSVGADVSIQGRLTSDPCNAQLQSSNMTPVCVAHLRAQYLRSVTSCHTPSQYTRTGGSQKLCSICGGASPISPHWRNFKLCRPNDRVKHRGPRAWPGHYYRAIFLDNTTFGYQGSRLFQSLPICGTCLGKREVSGTSWWTEQWHLSWQSGSWMYSSGTELAVRWAGGHFRAIFISSAACCAVAACTKSSCLHCSGSNKACRPPPPARLTITFAVTSLFYCRAAL
uniref:uncharacterized protein isoform X4 n=1 Tax=Myxine glutinosa TaxID=7769 RepID=UPI00358E8C1F